MQFITRMAFSAASRLKKGGFKVIYFYRGRIKGHIYLATGFVRSSFLKQFLE